MPKLIEWSDKFSVGVPSIDVQHMKILDMINILNAGVSSGKSKEALNIVFRNMIAYTSTHFAYEEELLVSAGYHELERHKREHEVFIKKIEDLREKAEHAEKIAPVLMEANAFLKDWIVGHILTEDKKYSEILVKNKIR